MIRSSVLTDEMWARIEPLLPPEKGAMGRPMRPHREVIEGAIYRLRTGVARRVSMPAENGPCGAAWVRGRIRAIVAT